MSGRASSSRKPLSSAQNRSVWLMLKSGSWLVSALRNAVPAKMQSMCQPSRVESASYSHAALQPNRGQLPATPVRSIRVGSAAQSLPRTLRIRPIELAVRAHVRHEHTPYDGLLARGRDRLESRTEVDLEVARVIDAWLHSPDG